MPEKDTHFLQWIIGLIITFFTSWNIFNHRRLDKIKDNMHGVELICVDKPSCKEDRDKIDKSIDEIKDMLREGLKEFKDGVTGVHDRIDRIIDKR